MFADPAATVVTMNVAAVAPAGTLTEAGTVATPALLLVSVTIAAPVGAPLDSDTVPCTGVPTTAEVGFNVIAASVAAAGGGVGFVGVSFEHAASKTATVTAIATAVARTARVERRFFEGTR